MLRGGCTACGCDSYDGGSEKKKCVNCGHAPGKHQNMTSTGSISSPVDTSTVSTVFMPSSLTSDSTSPIAAVCAVPGCTEEASFDLNTGIQSKYCDKHDLFMTMDGFTIVPQLSSLRGDSNDLAAVATASSESSEAEDDEIKHSQSSDCAVGSDSRSSKATSVTEDSTKRGRILASMFSSLFRSRADKPSESTSMDPIAKRFWPSAPPTPPATVTSTPPSLNPAASLSLSSEIIMLKKHLRYVYIGVRIVILRGGARVHIVTEIMTAVQGGLFPV